MREIKFRVWNKILKNGFMTYSHTYRRLSEFFLDSCESPNGRVDKKNVKIMQFIGLETREGKEIYEGDIIECRDGKYIIEYVENFAKFIMTRGNSIQDADTCMRSIQIIGNICENPDLEKELKEAKEVDRE